MAKSLGITANTAVVIKGPYESSVKVATDNGKDVLYIFSSCDIMVDGTIFNEVPIKELKLI